VTIATWTGADFDRLSWHDCHIWGIDLRPGDPDAGDWTSDLVLDIDFIVDWVCGAAPDAPMQFRVAPATLVFHGVTDPRIAIDWGRSGHQIALHAASIDGIDRERVAEQKVYLDRPYYSWTVRLNWPSGGEIAFGAVDFTQTLLAEPVLKDQQCLTRAERMKLAGR
jgi:hypothetical protein